MEGKANSGYVSEEHDKIPAQKTITEQLNCDEKFFQVEPHKETLYEKLTSCRWAMAYMGCLCYALIYAMRTNMSIAIVCMVKIQNVTSAASNSSSSVGSCGIDPNQEIEEGYGGDIEWDKTTQGWILGAFFYGYLLTQIPSGILAGRFGGKRVMLCGVGMFGLSTVLVPVAARFDGRRYHISAILVITLRFISGISCGAVSPAMFSLLGRWIPTYERSRLTALSVSGQMLGSIMILGVGGFFCEWEAFDGGWPSIFYTSGGLSVIFCIIWSLAVYDGPEDHPRISQRELKFIQANIEHGSTNKKRRVPWMKIMVSPAMWAIIIGHVCFNFGHYAIMTKLPAYMKEVLHMDIKSNGLLSTLPHLAMFIMANLSSSVVDKLRQKQIVRTIVARKLATGIALIIPAGFLVACGFIPCDRNYLGVVFLTIAVGLTGLISAGLMPNHHDIAAKYSGEIYGIGNMFATIPGIVAPSLVNSLTPNGTVEEWRVVFYIWGAVFVFGAIFFAILARGETQDWALESPDISEPFDDPSEAKLSDEPSEAKLSDNPSEEKFASSESFTSHL